MSKDPVKETKALFGEDQFAPLLSDGFESIGLFKDYIQADRYGGHYDVGLPCVIDYDGNGFMCTLHRTIDMDGYLADPANYYYITRVQKFHDALQKAWKKHGPSLSFDKTENIIKWKGKNLNLEQLTEATLQLQTIWNAEAGTKQPVIPNKIWAWTFGGVPKITKKINLGDINGYLTMPETVRKNRLTVVASTRQATVPWAEFLIAYDQVDMLPQIFDLYQHSYAQYIHMTGEEDFTLGMVQVYLSKLTQGIQITDSIDIDAWMFYNLNNIAGFSLTQTMMDGKPALNRENLFLDYRYNLTLNVEDFMTDKQIIARRCANAGLGHYPNAFDTGQRTEYLLPIGKDVSFIKRTEFEDTMQAVDSEFNQCTPIGGYDDNSTPFEVQDAEFNKQIGMIRDLKRDYKIIRVKTVSPYNVVLRPPDNKYGVPKKFWPIFLYLPKVTFVFYQFVGEIVAWYSNIYSIYRGNIFKMDPGQFKTENFTVVKMDDQDKAVEASILERPVNFTMPRVTKIGSKTTKVPKGFEDIYNKLFGETTTTVADKQTSPEKDLLEAGK